MKPEVIMQALGENPPKATLYYGQNVLSSLKDISDNSIHTICTSPPYYGLRSYGTEPQVWGGNPRCQHEWGDTIPQNSRHLYTGENSTKEGTVAEAEGYPKERGAFCQYCGAWRGELGGEPTPHLYVAHLVEVFRELRRVLREDGTVWLNLGDSYANDTKWGGRVRLRDDLTDEQIAYVLCELSRIRRISSLTHKGCI